MCVAILLAAANIKMKFFFAPLDGPRGEREKQAWFTRHTRAQDPSERGA